MKHSRLVPVAMALLALAAPPAYAQDGGPFLTREADSRVQVKREGHRSWIRVTQSRLRLLEGDSVMVEAGGRIRLCLRNGNCTQLGAGEYRVEPSAEDGVGADGSLKALVQSVRTLAAMFVKSPLGTVRSTRPFVQRASEFPEPPALLLPDSEPAWTIAAHPIRLVWLPGTSESNEIQTRVRVYRNARQDACAGGSLLLDTLATGHSLNLPSVGEGARYRVELAATSGTLYDTGCFVAATSEQRSALHARIAELRSGLRAGTASEEVPFDEDLFIIGLLVAEGYHYDALLLLDRLLESAPGDPSLLELWGVIGAQAGLFRAGAS